MSSCHCFYYPSSVSWAKNPCFYQRQMSPTWGHGRWKTHARHCYMALPYDSETLLKSMFGPFRERFWKMNAVFKTSSWMCLARGEQWRLAQSSYDQSVGFFAQNEGFRRLEGTDEISNRKTRQLRYSHPESKSSLPPEGEWTLQGHRWPFMSHFCSI